MNISDISADQLHRAAAIKEQIEKLEGELTGILGTGAPAAAAVAAPQKRKMSRAARALISATQKKRWAAKRQTSVVEEPIAKRTMSAAAKKKLSDFQKARWAKLKGAAPSATAKPATKKKFTMSAAAKAEISKAAKARWAKIKAAKK